MSGYAWPLIVCLTARIACGMPTDEAAQLTSVVTSEEGPEDVIPQSTDEARRQATLLHEAYVATLLIVHREYFDEDERDTLPARAFEDVFKQMDARTRGTTRWISVNTPAMNVDHEPQTDFEKSAARELTKGSHTVEQVTDNIYRRAAGIPFAASCSKCHQSALGNRRSGRMAGLVISLPVTEPVLTETFRKLRDR